jgi:endonuclease/exonuclease/phosphatase family metal-dependent hydrolase
MVKMLMIIKSLLIMMCIILIAPAVEWSADGVSGTGGGGGFNTGGDIQTGIKSGVNPGTHTDTTTSDANQKNPASDPLTISLMSYNLRVDLTQDGINRWDNRKEHVAALIRLYQPDFLGQQEGLIHQVEYLGDHLAGYAWIGVGRDNGRRAGELSSIHYNTARFELVEGSDRTIWLSKTPDMPGKSWDAAYPRILTWGQFRHIDTGHTLFVFNTHFDHVGQTARKNSAKLILRTIKKVAGSSPYVLLGDFNVTEDNRVYRLLTEGSPPLKDAFYHTETPHVGPLFTFEGFEVKSALDKRRIDYIFVPADARVLNHAIIGHFRNGYYPSDHLPVYAIVQLPTSW